MAVSNTAPSFSAGTVELQDALKVLNGLGELLPCAQDAGDGVHGWDGPLIVTQSLFVRIQRAIKISHQFGQATCFYEDRGQYRVT